MSPTQLLEFLEENGGFTRIDIDPKWKKPPVKKGGSSRKNDPELEAYR
jgi:hypothetical protein